MTGSEDADVPPDLSRAFAAAAGAELLEVAGGDHYVVMTPADPAFGRVWRRILEIVV